MKESKNQAIMKEMDSVAVTRRNPNNHRFDMPENTPMLLAKQDHDWHELYQKLSFNVLRGIPLSLKDEIELFRTAERLRYRYNEVTLEMHDRLMTLILDACRKKLGEDWSKRLPGEQTRTVAISYRDLYQNEALDDTPVISIKFDWPKRKNRLVPCGFSITFINDTEIDYNAFKGRIVDF